jgi:HK97 family phage major capsid protein
VIDRPAQNWVDSADAARLCGRSRQYVERMGQAGDIRKTITNGRMMFWANDLGKLVTTPDEGASLGEGVRALMLDHIARSGYGVTIGGVDRPIPTDQLSIMRDWNAIGGPDGGYLIGQALVDTFLDKVRSWEPLNRVSWLTTSERSFTLPTTLESTRVPGGRWGGCLTRFAPAYGSDLSAVPAGTFNQPQVGVVQFVEERLICYGPQLTNDLLADSTLVEKVIVETAVKEIALTMIDSMIGGVGATFMPGCIVGGNATVQVPRAGAGAISTADIDGMWGRLYGPCRRNAVWLVNADALIAIDKLAITEGWQYATYMPQGVNGNDFPLLKGRPLLDVESCPAFGQIGDLILLDPSQILVAVMVPKAPGGRIESPMLWGVRNTMDVLRELPVQFQRSEHRYWDQDITVMMTKLRCCIRPLWSQPHTPANSSTGNTLSAFVVLSR